MSFRLHAYSRRLDGDTAVLVVQGSSSSFGYRVQNGGGPYGESASVAGSSDVADAPLSLDLSPVADGQWRVEIEVPMDEVNRRTAFVYPRHFLSGHSGDPAWDGSNGMPDRTVVLDLGV